MAATTDLRRKRRSQYQLAPPWLTWRRAVAAVTAVVVLLVGTYGVRLVMSVSNLFHTDPISALRTLIGGHGDSQVGQSARDLRRINIALYGYGGPGHDGPYLTDSIMVVSIQPMPQGPARIAEISLPRDWYVPIDLGGGRTAMGRVNEAYESGQIGSPHRSDVYSGGQGGGRLADATLERMLGIHIDYFVGIDFDAFKEAVDSVGGIDVDVQNAFTDHSYPRGECAGDHPDCSVETVRFAAGRQHMDGARALIFARSRESSDPNEGSNFARNKRQQLVLTAVKQKVLSAGGLRNLPDLVNALGNHVIFNVPLDDSLSLYDLVKDVSPASIVHLSIDSTNFIYECDYPRSCTAALEFPHDRTFSSVSRFTRDIFVDPAALAEHAPVTVVDAAGRGNGAATRWASLLGVVGLSATDGGVERTSRTTHVYDESGGRDARTARWLADYFGVGVETPSAGTSGSTATGQGGVTVVLGRDEEAAFNNPSAGLYR